MLKNVLLFCLAKMYRKKRSAFRAPSRVYTYALYICEALNVKLQSQNSDGLMFFTNLKITVLSGCSTVHIQISAYSK